MLSDCELLRRYVENNSEAAFTELVQRHVNVVYRAAFRRVGRNAHSADDVTQRVFTDLARKAGTLLDRSNLAGWLYTSTRFAAAEVVRTEQRRRAREQEAQAMHELDSNSTLSADRLEPFLDEVMDHLPAQDRDAVLLHFFQGHAFAEVGAQLSLSPDAARMRVNRALERLRTGFARRGIVSSAGALAALLSAQATFAAPAPLALAVASQALAQSASLGAGVSVVSRLLQGLKAASAPVWCGSAAAVALVSLTLFLNRSIPDPTLAAEASTEDVSHGTPRSNQPFAAAAPPSPAASLASVPSSASSTSSITSIPPSASVFGSLSKEEKNLLSKLWPIEEFDSGMPSGRIGLRVGLLAPNSDGCAPLIEKGWAKMNANRVIVLTKVGLNFCTMHRDEIEAYAKAQEVTPPRNQTRHVYRSSATAPETH